MKLNFNLLFFLTVVAALIASLATFPYGYKFATLFNLPNDATYVIVGCLLGGSASLANAILGIYSLSNIKITQKGNLYGIATLSTLGAIPTGFFSYFGYNHILPISLNVITSIIVVIVNTGINFTAIVNLLKNIKNFLEKKQASKKVNWFRTVICAIGGIVGVLISLTAYLATTNGIAHIAMNYISSQAAALYIGSTLAIIAWLPLGALYLNSTEIVTEKIYDFFVKLKYNSKHIRIYDLLLIIFVLLSGTAFSRMVYDFYDPKNMIPDFFKLPFIQAIAYHYLMPLALVSSAAVNYFAFINIIKSDKFNNKK